MQSKAPLEVERKLDPVQVFLHRAHARLMLLEVGDLEPAEALMGLAPAFLAIVHPICSCGCDLSEDLAGRMPPHRRATA